MNYLLEEVLFAAVRCNVRMRFSRNGPSCYEVEARCEGCRHGIVFARKEELRNAARDCLVAVIRDMGESRTPPDIWVNFR